MNKKKIKKKIKIYIFHPYSGKGGADLSISRLINGLNKRKYEIDFLSLNKHIIKKKILKKIKYKKINSARTLFSFLKIINYIKQDKKEYKKKIFVSNQYFANILSIIFIKKIKNIKVVLLERNHLDEFKYVDNLLDFFKKKIIKILMKFYYKRADLIIGNSHDLSLSLQKFVNTKIETIYNPCYFPGSINYKKSLINKKINILNVARLENQKDHITLLNAIKNLKNKINYRLNIVGYGSQYLNIINYIKDNDLQDVVKIHQNVDYPSKFYKKADLFVLSSLYEGFPNVLVEAAQYNIPIISTNCNSGPREILLGGRGGELVEKKDYMMLAKKIELFSKNKNRFLKKSNICKKNLYKFSNKYNLSKFENFFDNL